jgi:two-component system KDP operon response regulator KdpE
MNTIMAIDTDKTVHERQTAEWQKYGIGTLRINSINEAISHIMQGDLFLFIAINEDTIPDFMSKLPILRDITNQPIFVITSNYTIDKKVQAMHLGADVYDPFDKYVKKNVIAALEILDLQNRWVNRPLHRSNVLIGRDIILSESRHDVFINDIKVSLTKLEFDMLKYLLMHNGNIVTHTQILNKVMESEYTENGSDFIWRTISRLRSKISEVAPGREYIKAERGVGYKFIE